MIYILQLLTHLCSTTDLEYNIDFRNGHNIYLSHYKHANPCKIFSYTVCMSFEVFDEKIQICDSSIRHGIRNIQTILDSKMKA